MSARGKTGILTRTPLEDAQFARLLDGLARYEWRHGSRVWNGVEYSITSEFARRVVLFLWATAAHPYVLAHPRAKQLEVDPDGLIHFVRAKKKADAERARIVIAPPPVIEPWYREFVSTLPDLEAHCQKTPVVRRYKRDTKDGHKKGEPRVNAQGEVVVGEACSCSAFYTLLVKQVSRDLGIGDAEYGFLTPRGLRHTRAAQLYERSHDANLLQDLTGTSLQVGLEYARREANRAAQERIRRGEL